VHAAQSLELATRMSQIIGMPIENAIAACPGHWSAIVCQRKWLDSISVFCKKIMVAQKL